MEAVTSRRGARKKIRHGIEIQAPAEVAVENLGNGSASKFVTKFDVVLPGFPGNIVDVVPVGIHAVARIAFVGAQLRETRPGNRNDRQSKIEGIVIVRRADTYRIQTD